MQAGSFPYRLERSSSRYACAPLVDWLHQDHAGDIEPIIAVGMAHYQFETLHPSGTATGLGRFLIVLTSEFESAFFTNPH